MPPDHSHLLFQPQVLTIAIMSTHCVLGIVPGWTTASSKKIHFYCKVTLKSSRTFIHCSFKCNELPIVPTKSYTIYIMSAPWKCGRTWWHATASNKLATHTCACSIKNSSFVFSFLSGIIIRVLIPFWNRPSIFDMSMFTHIIQPIT